MIKKFCPKVLKCTVIQKKCIFCDKRALFLGTSSAPARGFLKKKQLPVFRELFHIQCELL